MPRNGMKKRLIVFLLLIVAAIAFYSQRVIIQDTFFAEKKILLPESISFEELQEEKQEEMPQNENRDETMVEEKDEEISDIPPEEEIPIPPIVTEEEIPEENTEPSDTDLLKEINLAVPFTPQAPYADWELPYKEACEEASIYMIHVFYEGMQAGLIDPGVAKEQIDQLVAFEQSLFGFYEDTDATKTGILAEQFYGYGNIAIREDPTIEEIKRHLIDGRPVIIPADGQQLGNPYFQQPGPPYHMLVIKGYTEEGFITNDPGTRRGENFVYGFDVLMNAMHDFNDGNVPEGRKVMIVVYP